MAIKSFTQLGSLTFSRSKLNKSRRGFFYTMIALLLVSLFFVYFQISVIRQSQPASVANTARINSVSLFVNDLGDFYLPNILSISLRSAVIGATNFLAGGNTFIASTNQSAMFYQLITNGTLYPFNTTVFSNETLNSLLTTFTSLSNSELNIPLVINYTPYSFTITQSSPWTITANMVFLYTINANQLAIVNRTLQVSATVPITGVRDPYFLINTRGSYAPNITQTNISIWNISLFKAHISAQVFAANPAAPSFLNRLANNTAASPNGIEFFVNSTMFGLNGAPVNYSFVDYQFWTRPWNCTPTDGSQRLYNITGITDQAAYKNTLVDGSHASRYLNRTESTTLVGLVCY